jgi:hypothetical protein
MSSKSKNCLKQYAIWKKKEIRKNKVSYSGNNMNGDDVSLHKGFWVAAPLRQMGKKKQVLTYVSVSTNLSTYSDTWIIADDHE